jgi:hypothetical protein
MLIGARSASVLTKIVSSARHWGFAVKRISEFNEAFEKVLALTEATTTECELRTPGSVERIQCEAKLLALHQVIGFFLEIDSRRFGGPW